MRTTSRVFDVIPSPSTRPNGNVHGVPNLGSVARGQGFDLPINVDPNISDPETYSAEKLRVTRNVRAVAGRYIRRYCLAVGLPSGTYVTQIQLSDVDGTPVALRVMRVR